MEATILTATPEAAGQRLDAFLAETLPELTRSAAQRLIAEGQVAVDGKIPAKSLKLAGGETVSVRLPEPEEAQALPEDIPLDVVYEDDDVIVVNKPVGMVVHPAPGHSGGTLVNALLHHCGDSLSGIGGELRPGIVHRIDRDTSGLIIAAKNDFAHQALSAQLQDHSLCRTYEAVVVGNLREDSGTVDAPIGRCPSDRKRWQWSARGAGTPLLTGRCWSGFPAIPMSAAGWRQAAPIRSGSIWPTLVTLSMVTRCTEPKSRRPV